MCIKKIDEWYITAHVRFAPWHAGLQVTSVDRRHEGHPSHSTKGKTVRAHCQYTSDRQYNYNNKL